MISYKIDTNIIDICTLNYRPNYISYLKGNGLGIQDVLICVIIYDISNQAMSSESHYTYIIRFCI